MFLNTKAKYMYLLNVSKYTIYFNLLKYIYQ